MAKLVAALASPILVLYFVDIVDFVQVSQHFGAVRRLNSVEDASISEGWPKLIPGPCMIQEAEATTKWMMGLLMDTLRANWPVLVVVLLDGALLAALWVLIKYMMSGESIPYMQLEQSEGESEEGAEESQEQTDGTPSLLARAEVAMMAFFWLSDMLSDVYVAYTYYTDGMYIFSLLLTAIWLGSGCLSFVHRYLSWERCDVETNPGYWVEGLNLHGELPSGWRSFVMYVLQVQPLLEAFKAFKRGMTRELREEKVLAALCEGAPSSLLQIYALLVSRPNGNPWILSGSICLSIFTVAEGIKKAYELCKPEDRQMEPSTLPSIALSLFRWCDTFSRIGFWALLGVCLRPTDAKRQGLQQPYLPFIMVTEFLMIALLFKSNNFGLQMKWNELFKKENFLGIIASFLSTFWCCYATDLIPQRRFSRILLALRTFSALCTLWLFALVSSAEFGGECSVTLVNTRGRELGTVDAELVDLPWAYAPLLFPAMQFRGGLAAQFKVTGFSFRGTNGRPSRASSDALAEAWINEMDPATAQEYLSLEELPEGEESDGQAEAPTDPPAVQKLQENLYADLEKEAVEDEVDVLFRSSELVSNAPTAQTVTVRGSDFRTERLQALSHLRILARASGLNLDEIEQVAQGRVPHRHGASPRAHVPCFALRFAPHGAVSPRKITSVAWTWWAKSMADEWLLESKSTGDETWTLRRSSVRDGVSAAPSDFNAEAELEGKGHLDPWNFGVFFGLRSFTATGRDDFAADGARAAWPGALRGAAPGLWFALEHPRARCEVDGAARRLSPEEPEVWRLARCTLRLAERVAGNAHANHAVHGGIEEYLEEVRGWPFGQILHYNSWYDLRSPSCDAADRRCFAHEMGEKNCADRLKVFNGNLSHWTAEHHLDAFLLDDGWDNPDSLWEVDDARFPEGFAPLVRHAKQMGTRLGVWMSPFGGYGAAGARRVRFGAAKGFERSKRGSFALAGPKYFQNFQAKVKQRISEGFGIFKFDGLGGGLGQSGGEEDRNDFEAMLSLLEAPSERDGSRKREANRFQGISF
eukprot:g17335.t1